MHAFARPYLFAALDLRVMQVMGKTWHVECLSCTVCQTSVKGGMYKREGFDWPVCLAHAKNVTGDEEEKLVDRQKAWDDILKVCRS